MKVTSLLLILLALAGCASPLPAPQNSAKLVLTKVTYADLDGWNSDALHEALAAFKPSCAALMAKPAIASMGLGGTTADWHEVCAAMPLAEDDDARARAFVETFFTPYAVSGGADREGLFTGYYAPEMDGSLTPSERFHIPLYTHPSDLIGVDLGAFKAALKGQHIEGKLSAGKLIPYDDRAAIAKGSLQGRAQPLAWLDDPINAFFLEVQGSGVVRLEDGSVMPVGYDGSNGRMYVAIGRVLADQGRLTRPVTLNAIRGWLQTHPDQAQEVMNANPSYVFFRRLSDANILGAEGVPLTAERSLAVDLAVLPLGVPLWLETHDGEGQPFRHLMIAQDTGGAIKGIVRGDVYWGTSVHAELEAGAMQSQGRYYLLLPKTVSVESSPN